MAAPPPVMAARSQPKGWLATLAVALIMIGVAAGGCYAAAAVADLPNQPIEIANGVTIIAPEDWQFADRPVPNTVLLSRGTASMAITVEQGTDERAALAWLRDEWVAMGTITPGAIEVVTDVRPDQPAARFGYSGTFPEISGGAVEGEDTAVRGSSVVVVFDAWAGTGDFVSARDEVAAIIRQATIP
jgi:hypothetical protein